MFKINEDLSIYLTRGDHVSFGVTAENEDDGQEYIFRAGELVRFKVVMKKACQTVLMQKDFPVEEDTAEVDIVLTKEDTKIGDEISKPTDYWYEVELNPDSQPKTLIGYDEDGAKVFRLYPEGGDFE